MSAAAVQLLCFVYPLHEYCTTACLVCQVVHHRKYLDRPSKLLAAVCVQACRSASAWWRFGLFWVGCGCWGVVLPLIKMTTNTQQYAPTRTYTQ